MRIPFLFFCCLFSVLTFADSNKIECTGQPPEAWIGINMPDSIDIRFWLKSSGWATDTNKDFCRIDAPRITTKNPQKIAGFAKNGTFSAATVKKYESNPAGCGVFPNFTKPENFKDPEVIFGEASDRNWARVDQSEKDQMLWAKTWESLSSSLAEHLKSIPRPGERYPKYTVLLKQGQLVRKLSSIKDAYILTFISEVSARFEKNEMKGFAGVSRVVDKTGTVLTMTSSKITNDVFSVYLTAKEINMANPLLGEFKSKNETVIILGDYLHLELLVIDEGRISTVLVSKMEDCD